MLNSTFKTALVAAALIASLLAGIYASIGTVSSGAGILPPAADDGRDRVSLALVERNSEQLLVIRPAFVFYINGRAVFVDGGIPRNESGEGTLPKYNTVSNIDRTALMRDLGSYSTFAKMRSDYVISQPEDPRGLIFVICESSECKRIEITGTPMACRRRGSDCNLSQMPAELTKAIDYLSDFVHPDSESFPLPKIEVIFTPKSKEEIAGSMGRSRGLPVPLVLWPSDWPGLPAPSSDGNYHILIDAANLGKLSDLARGLRVEDFGMIRQGLLSINGKTGLPKVAIPLPGLESWVKN